MDAEEQQQEQAGFDQAFATDTEPATQVADEVKEQPEPEAQPTQPDQEASTDAASTEAVDEDPVLLDGLKRSELRRLLGNAADVESLRRQMDKAHGHIGDLNRRVQQVFPSKPKELSPELKQFEDDYPEFAQYVKGLGFGVQAPPAQEPEVPPAQSSNEVSVQPATQAGIDPVVVEMAVLDRMHAGWRDTVQSPDFSTWLAAQGDQAQTAFNTASTADEMTALLGRFDAWSTERNKATDRATKGQQRLHKAVTPSGTAQRPQAAMTELEAFEAAFRS